VSEIVEVDDYNCLDYYNAITAPDQQRVRLDFRDDFHIEPSEDCGNDQLEIRDGPFGYSRLVGRFCGTIRPPLIESTGGYLWLRFYSDDSIEYIGFRAVYEYYSPREGTNNAGIKLYCIIFSFISKQNAAIYKISEEN